MRSPMFWVYAVTAGIDLFFFLVNLVGFFVSGDPRMALFAFIFSILTVLGCLWAVQAAEESEKKGVDK